MKRRKHLLMTTLMLLSFITASAYDFMVDGIAYNVVSLPDMTCEVTTADNKYSGDIVIPSTVTYQSRTLSVIGIESRTFEKCKKLTFVEIPNSVTGINDSTFSGCSSLTSVEIPNSVTTIGDYVFKGCTSLTSVIIPNAVTEIGESAFEDCSSLTSVEIPNSVTEIRLAAFKYCRSLISVEIPKSVTTIGESAFYRCESLTSVEIPNSVTEIGDRAFYECESLTSVEIPNSVTEIGDRAFYGCESLTSVGIPNSVTKIGYYAFCSCSSLTSVEIPKSVTTIDRGGFENCPIKYLIWGPDMDIVFYTPIPHMTAVCTYIESQSLEYLQILPVEDKPRANIKFHPPQGLKVLSLGRAYGTPVLTFTGPDVGTKMPELSDLYLTGHVKYAYIDAPNLKNITIDKNVELDPIDYGADMSQYTTLECVTMKGNVPKFVPTFANAVYLNATLRVPKGTKQAYQNAEGWKNFWNIEESEEEVGIDEVPEAVATKTECGRYDLQGRPVDESYRGVSIVRYTDGSAKKLVTAR